MIDLTALALNLPVFLLVLIRASGIMIAAPILSSNSLPVQIRVALAFLLSIVMYPFAAHFRGDLPTTVLGYLPLVITELGMGLLLGFAGGLVIAAMAAAGGLAAQQIGLTMGEMASPDTDEESDEVTVFFEIFALLLLLAIDGHHLFIQALAASFREVPLGHVHIGAQTAAVVTGQFSNMFIIALRASAPLMGLMFVVTVAVALMAKAVPQMDILMVGYPVKVFLGIMAMALTFPLTWPVMRDAFGGLQHDLIRVMHSL